LQGLPELSQEAGRRQVLELAGLGQLAPRIDLSGPPFLAVSQIVSYLAQYGRLTYEHEALGLFLNVVKSFVGLEPQDLLASLLTNHHVLPQSGLVPQMVFRFNYEENWKGEAQPVDEYRAKPGGIFHNNQTLDYAIVELDREPGGTWGWLPLRPAQLKRDDRVN